MLMILQEEVPDPAWGVPAPVCQLLAPRRLVSQLFLSRAAPLFEQELDFEVPFEMRVTAPGPLSGWVIYFDTGFFAKSDPPPPPQAPAQETQGTVPQVSDSTKGVHKGSGDIGLRNGVDCGGEGSSSMGGVGEEGERNEAEEGPRPRASWFSTGPLSPPTHWKQTLLWLRPSDRPGSMEVGDRVSGTLALSRNEINPRELSLRVTWETRQGATGEVYGGSQSYVVT